METIERIEQSITCDRCGRVDRWIGTAGYVTFPDGWSLVYPEWHKEYDYDTDDPPPIDSLWVCADCLTDADDEGLSWALELSSDAGAPPIELLEENPLHDCDKEYRSDCASCNGVNPGDVGCW